MNANELANELTDIWRLLCPDYTMIQAATMLRQQQAEIEELKKDNKELHAIAQRMAMAESDARKSLQSIKDHTADLTDEEIFAIAIPTEIDGTDEEVLTFARAILRKAQEK